MNILERDRFNAFCHHTHVDLPFTGSGLLDGLTFGLKDNFDVAGHRTGFGSPDWLRTHEPAIRHAKVLATLLAAGASMAGRTHTEEMAFSLTGENAHYGTPINPAAPDRIPGGSSSGSASAVAGRLVDFSIGTDTGGSVRIPSSFCGLWGIRPTYGRISMDGVCPLAPSFDTCGWFARDPLMLQRVGQVLLASASDDSPGQQTVPEAGDLLYAADAFANTTPGIDEALMPAVNQVSMTLGSVRPVTVAPDGLRVWYEVFRVLEFAEIWSVHREWIRQTHPSFGPQIAPRFVAASRISASEVKSMKARQEEIVQRLDTLLADNAVLVLPTAPDTAPRRSLPPDAIADFRERAQALLCIAGLGGLPQLTMPLTLIDELPIGLSLIAARGNDGTLLDLACRISENIVQNREP